MAALDRSGIMRGPKGILIAAKRPVEGRERKDHIRTPIRIGVSRVMRVPVGDVARARGISLCDRRQQHGGTGGEHQITWNTRHQKTPLLSASETSGYHERLPRNGTQPIAPTAYSPPALRSTGDLGFDRKPNLNARRDSRANRVPACASRRHERP